MAGCGSSGRASRAGRIAAAGQAARTSNGEAAKPAGSIVADAAGALRTTHSFHLHGTIRQGRQLMRVGLTMGSPTTFDATFAVGSEAFEIVELPPASYLRANAAFWRSRVGAKASRLTGQWLRVPATSERGLTSVIQRFSPATLARCLTEGHGTLQKAGTATIGGTPVVVVRDNGDVPGGGRGQLYVAAAGRPYPLRVSGTGRQRPGGRIDVCNDGKGSDNRGSVTLSDFNAVPAIQPPTAAVSGPSRVQGA